MGHLRISRSPLPPARFLKIYKEDLPEFSRRRRPGGLNTACSLQAASSQQLPVWRRQADRTLRGRGGPKSPWVPASAPRSASGHALLWTFSNCTSWPRGWAPCMGACGLLASSWEASGGWFWGLRFSERRRCWVGSQDAWNPGEPEPAGAAVWTQTQSVFCEEKLNCSA